MSSSAKPPDSDSVTSDLKGIMSAQHKQTFLAASKEFVANCNITSILFPLVSEKVLSIEEAKKLDSFSTESEKSSYLLMHLAPYKPDSAYDKLLNILKQNHQEHIAAVLEKELLKIIEEAKLKEPTANKNNRLVQWGNSKLDHLQLAKCFSLAKDELEILNQNHNDQKKNIGEREELISLIENEIMLLKWLLQLAEKRLKILGFGTGSSILCVFYCFDAEGEVNLSEMLESGELKEIVISIFRCLSAEFAQLYDCMTTVQKSQIILCRHGDSVVVKENDDYSFTRMEINCFLETGEAAEEDKEDKKESHQALVSSSASMLEHETHVENTEWNSEYLEAEIEQCLDIRAAEEINNTSDHVALKQKELFSQVTTGQANWNDNKMVLNEIQYRSACQQTVQQAADILGTVIDSVLLGEISSRFEKPVSFSEPGNMLSSASDVAIEYLAGLCDDIRHSSDVEIIEHQLPTDIEFLSNNTREKNQQSCEVCTSLESNGNETNLGFDLKYCPTIIAYYLGKISGSVDVQPFTFLEPVIVTEVDHSAFDIALNTNKPPELSAETSRQHLHSKTAVNVRFFEPSEAHYPTNLGTLPVTVLETIILKSFVTMYCQMMKTGNHNIKGSVCCLAALCSNWRLVAMSRKWFLKKIQYEILRYVRFKLFRHHEFMFRNLECQFGLLTELHQSKVVSDVQYAIIQYFTDSEELFGDLKGIFILLAAVKQITKLQQFEDFLNALKNTDQQHVAAYIFHDGVSEDCGENRALTDEELFRLEVNLLYLCDHINIEAVINDLQELGCVTDNHKKYLLSLSTIDESKAKLLERNRNKQLLGILQRRSLRSFKRLMDYRRRFRGFREYPPTLVSSKAKRIFMQKEETSYYSRRLRNRAEYLGSQLVDCLGSGLIDELVSRHVISALKAENLHNQALIKIMISKKDYNQYEEFLISLWKTNQVHLARYIISDVTGDQAMFGNMSGEGLSIEVDGTSSVDIREDNKVEEMKEFYQHLIQHSQSHVARVFVVGSTSEIPEQQHMLHHYGLSLDLLGEDYMIYATYIYVTARRERVPDQFNDQVLRISSSGLHAGYVKLFDEDVITELKCADLLPVTVGNILRGPAETLSAANCIKYNETLKHLLSKENWLAYSAQSNTIVMQDRVFAVHSRCWPLEINEWITRRRLSGLPSKSIIKLVIRYGCDFVQVSHMHSTDTNEWRFSFSKAEIIIINSWTTSQRCVYLTLHTLNKIIKSSMDSSRLCTYYFKTLMLWATEEKEAEFWSEHVLVNSVYQLLYELMHWLERKFCPNYFIPTNNMIDHLTDTELSDDIDTLGQLLQNQNLIVDVLSKSKSVEAVVTNEKCYIKVPVWLYTSLLIREQLEHSEDIFTRLFANSSSALIDSAISIELSHIYLGLYCYIMGRNSLIQTDNYYLMKSLKHFHCDGASHGVKLTVLQCCSRAVARRVIPKWFKTDTSESHALHDTKNAFISADSWNVLNVDNNQTDEKCLLSSQSMDNVDETITNDVSFNENIYDSSEIIVTLYSTSTVHNTTDTDVECYKEWPGISPTVNISWFIKNAYVANLYYITQQDYRETEKICDNIIDVCKKSYINKLFAEHSLPVTLFTEWKLVYDEELQAMLGLYSLCSFMFSKTDHSRSVYLGVCPALFAWYLKCRCAADQMDVRKWDECDRETNEHLKECECYDRRCSGQWAVNASLKLATWIFKQNF